MRYVNATYALCVYVYSISELICEVCIFILVQAHRQKRVPMPIVVFFFARVKCWNFHCCARVSVVLLVARHKVWRHWCAMSDVPPIECHECWPPIECHEACGAIGVRKLLRLYWCVINVPLFVCCKKICLSYAYMYFFFRCICTLYLNFDIFFTFFFSWTHVFHKNL